MSESFGTAAPPAKRRWVLWLVILIAVPILVLLGVLISIKSNFNSMLAELDRTDPGWRLEEIEANRPNYPTGQNAALAIPKIKALLTQNWKQLFYEPSSQSTQTLDNLDPPALLNDQQIDALKQIQKESAAAVAEARKLIDMPHGRHPITWSPDWISTILLCHDNRNAVAVLKYDALNLAQQGDADGALRSTQAAFNCGASIGDEPMAISQLVRVACQAVALSTLERVLAQTEPSEAALEAFQKRLEQVEKEPLLLYSFRGERAGEFHLFEWLKQGNSTAGLSGGGMAKGFDALSYYLRVPGVMASQTTACMRFMTEMIEVAKKPPEQWSTEFATLNQQVPNLPTLARLLVPAMDKVAQAVQRSYAQQRCAIVMLAAERFRKKNNRWPESLEELKQSGLLTPIPTDPYVGGPVKWKRMDVGVIVYAVGPDQTDGGGKLDRTNPIKPGTDVGFQLWDVAKRRQPAPPPKKLEDNP